METHPDISPAAEQESGVARLWARLRRGLQPVTRILALVLLAGVAMLAADTGPGRYPGAANQVFFGANDNIRFALDAISDPAALPAAAPPVYLDVPRETARELNAAIPFSALPNPAARPFILGGDEASQARAVDCLAAAQYYEAGTDPEGQRAVAQVVLNRVRHPAYPGNVCGVVFQGSERVTGCQFTFTCDGAMARVPSAAAWAQSQTIARAALAGAVYAKVGLATHYHTDWVVPVWSGELEKIVNVDTHLFFRWPGSWGRPGIFSRSPSIAEPVVTKLARISAAHREALTAAEEADLALELGADDPLLDLPDVSGSGPAPLPALPGINMRGSQLRLVHPDGDAFGFLLPRELPGAFGLLAFDVCGQRAFCKVMGWTDPAAIPRGFPVPFDAQEKMAFLYLYDRATRREIMAWDCDTFPRDNPAECLTGDMTRWDAVSQ